MTAARLCLLILFALVLQQLLPSIGVTDGGTVTTTAAWEDARALGAPRGTSPGSR
jgi:hypothetical protein